MQRSFLGLRIPDGMQDLLPEELALLENLENKILEVFKQWSYQKVLTPTIEHAACVGPDIDREDQLYKFFDRKGQILALRPELTTPIARLVSTRLKGAVLPLRFCYSADVFRYSGIRHREFRQLGVELVGSSSPLADAEVIALAVEGMQRLGLKDFQLNLGHMGIFSALASEMALDDEFQSALENALARKDMVLVERLVNQSALSNEAREFILKLPHLHGREEILEKVLELSSNTSIREAVNSLRAVYNYLKEFGVQDFVALDLGILRGFSYYTGVIFEGYVPGIGFPVVEGGRYDHLYEEFGDPLAATGFAIHLGSILDQFNLQPDGVADVFVYGSDPVKVISYAKRLRAEGKRVEMALDKLTDEQVKEIVMKKNIKESILVDSN